jgi:hypothetical protein
MATRYLVSALAIATAAFCSAQFTPGSDAYQAWKLSQIQHPQPDVHPPAVHVHGDAQRDDEPCACWIEPDSTYTLALEPNDDGSTAAIELPFTFSLYGEDYTSCYINNNGNVSFVDPYPTFSSTPFPNNTYVMVAPFWADVDTRADSGATPGTLMYRLTPHALYVNWSAVGYFPSMTDKLNTFQLIISDGTDPVIPGGNNVSFCYGSMQWTTGAASEGIGGFGGTPATVGANRGDGINYLQLGQFDHDSTDWDGPFGLADGVAWLTDRHYSFNTSDETIPPIFTSIGCDTIDIDAGTSSEYPMPECVTNRSHRAKSALHRRHWTPLDGSPANGLHPDRQSADGGSWRQHQSPPRAPWTVAALPHAETRCDRQQHWKVNRYKYVGASVAFVVYAVGSTDRVAIVKPERPSVPPDARHPGKEPKPPAVSSQVGAPTHR